MDGLDDARVHQTKMHHESFLPISVGTSAKASADIVTFFALTVAILKYYHY